MIMTLSHSLVFAALCCICLGSTDATNATMKAKDQSVTIHLGETAEISFFLSGFLSHNTSFSIDAAANHVLEEIWINQTFEAEGAYDEAEFNLTIDSIHEGKVTLQIVADSDEIDVSEAFVIVSVMKDEAYQTAGTVLGWVSTIAWDISFLPQIWHNFKRHSVVGLSFDFLTFNFIGFSFYFVFNAGLFWNTAIQEQYRTRNPNQLLPVQLNDVIFPLYAVICTAVQIVQCFLYPKLVGQKVSYPCRIICALLVLLVVIGMILVPCLESVLWLDVLYLMSYTKLFISSVKYTPQLYTNYKAKSTAGWNIWQVILDFTGGISSLMQMFLLAANYDDMVSVLTDPTKLGLGSLSVFFNIFFFMQHFWLYRGNEITYPDTDPIIDEKKEQEDQDSTRF